MASAFGLGDYRVEPALSRVLRGDQVYQVKPKSMEVLVCLAERPGKVCLKQSLLQVVWSDTFVTDDVLVHAIIELRKAFRDDAKDPRYIETIHTKGYRLIAPVTRPESEARFRRLKSLGRGAMGEVFLAEDTLLQRQVALKFVPQEFQEGELVHERFLREARTMAALDHPSICRIFEIGKTRGGQEYIAMEYVEGRTLRDRLVEGPVPLKEALQIVGEVAEALEMAHRKGIVHRDLKPANIMLTPEGRAKVMDFGLAKKVLREDGTEQDITSTLTRERSALGTLAYMSPEQVNAESVDCRSDIFSFGIILQEALTGVHPFRKAKKAETMAAILQQDSPPLSRYIDEVPNLLQHTVSKMLAKTPDRRYQSIHEVSTHLRELAQDSSKRKWSVPRWESWKVVIAVVTVLVVGIGWLIRDSRPVLEPLRTLPLTALKGAELAPSLSPDGTRVAFQWGGEEGENWDIYVKLVEGGPAVALTDHPDDDLYPVWSPDGRRIAFYRSSEEGSAIFETTPLPGGSERKLLDVDSFGGMAWSPDSRFLAVSQQGSPGRPRRIFRVSVSSREVESLTSPPEETAKGQGDRFPSWSPDGKTLAFYRCRAKAVCDVWIQALPSDAQAQRLTYEEYNSALGKGTSWSGDGQEVIYSARGYLWRVPASGGEPRLIPGISMSAEYPMASRDGNLLAYSQRTPISIDLWLLNLEKPKQPAQPFVQTTRWEAAPQFSPDGKRVVFASTQSGATEIWVCNRDGSDAHQITHQGYAGSPSWSPNSQWIAFDSRVKGESFHVFVIDAEGGEPRRLTWDSGPNYVPTWSQDGEWIYFSSDCGKERQIWKVPAQGGETRPVTRGGGHVGRETPDGRLLYYSKMGTATSVPGSELKPGDGIWRVAVEGGPETRVIDRPIDWTCWAMTAQGIYFLTQTLKPGGCSWKIELYRFATEQISLIAEGQSDNHLGRFSVSPDGKWLLSSQFAPLEADLMLVGNFR